MKSETRINVVSSNARPAASQKRASEPIISTIASQVTGGGDHHFQRNTSLAGSEYPTSTSQIRRPSDKALANTASTVDPLGLTLVYSAQEPLVDMIFIHGLGGTSRGTWPWERDARNFWPGWLVDDSELSRSRIFTFGYFANFLGIQSSLSILDFSKDLLFRMKTFSSEFQVDKSPIGKVCFHL
ncbi:hypothetical protein OCU04_004524 [Sclerotinia nivalis]|uniref:Uncharacterized protein n=1 Tax=Sclerotinia nivalis TaxID=352851 RepID=A0A9X0DM10_9HELO|nr:hypothetical protein OCU04_004524 [Sclerotinia nivalis]